jgi:hypothetical protein
MFTKRFLFAAFAVLLPVTLFSQIVFENDGIRLILDNSGRITSLKNKFTNAECLNKDTVSYFLSLISGNERHNPVSATFDKNKQQIVFGFEKSPVKVMVTKTTADKYFVFEAVRTEPANRVDAIAWGPVYTTISKKIGEVVGVVRDDKAAIGMLVLNPKTLGGLYNQNGSFEGRGALALPYKSGSSLQAYSINRDRLRHVETMGMNNIPVKPIHGETAAGSRIALFSCSEPEVLDLIEEIVRAEKLPYPTYKGVWTKKAFLHSPSYLISDFRQADIDTIISYAKRGGFFSVYHEGPFKTWGHYEIDTAYFPGGIEGLKVCAEKAKSAGLLFGAHTLTNFLNTSDLYVTPVPDKRLAITGYGSLMENIDSKTTQIQVSTKEYFNETKNNNLHTVRIGDELIRYDSVSENTPFKLGDCQRGAFGTRAANHLKGDTVKKLIDHGYKVFFPEITLQREIAVNLAKIFNKGEISHLDFDGHEGTFASGEGDYAYALFAEDFFRNIDHEFVDGTSNSKPYYWYINTLCNWGEPWYGGFNQSMQEYRISNQAMLERNYFPNMLGWYMLTKTTSPEEMEWMLARAAGYNAGFAMVTGIANVQGNPEGYRLLDLIREWERARLSGAFSDEQKERLKIPSNEFHLVKTGEKEWKLFQFKKEGPFLNSGIKKQPGEPASSTFEFSNRSFKQALRFIIEVRGNSGSFSGLKITLDNFAEVAIPDELKPGERISCDGIKYVRLYDEKGRQRKLIILTDKLPELSPGMHKLELDAKFTGDNPPDIEMKVSYLDYPEKVVGR